MFLACCMGLEVQAQQISGDFDAEWVACYPYQKASSQNQNQVGTEPAGWCVSNVYYMGGYEVAKEVANGTGKAVSLTNIFMGYGTLGQNAPAYLTLGTSWSAAKALPTITEKDGGSFGGCSFAYKPDAISFQYKRTHSETSKEAASVVAYLWNGTYTSSVGVGIELFSSPKKETMIDRDRDILGEVVPTVASGLEVTKTDGAACIAYINETISGDQAEWAKMTIPFNYVSDEAPEKLNIIFSAADYFGDRDAIGPGNTLTIDNVRLLYYSELATLTYDGQEVPVAAEMDLSTVEYDESKLSCTLTGRGATLEKAYDESTGVLTLTVKGNDWTEENRNEHVYTVQFAVPVPASEVEGTYNRQVTVEMAGSVISQTMNDILITAAGDGSYTLQLNDFFFSGSNLGNIVVPGVTAAYAEDGSISLTAPEQIITIDGPGAGLGELPVTLDMALADGKLTGSIGIVWNNMPIQVTVGDRTVQAADVEGTYNRQVTVEMAGSVISQTMNDILITAAGDGSYTLQLNDFFFSGSNLGNIVVPGVTAAYAEDGSISLTAPEQIITIDGPGAGLGELPVTLDMALADGKLTGSIGIVWNNMPIQVTVGDVPFQVEADGRTLTVTGTVSKQAAPAVVPADGSFLVIDLTQATLGEDVETGDFTNTQPNTLFYVAADTQLAGSNVVAGGACADLVITDAEDFYVPADFTATELAYNRTLTAGQYAAVVLPFGVDASQLDGTAYTLDGVDGDVLQFVTAEGTIDAHVPFLFRPADTKLFADDTELTVVPVYATPAEVPVVAYDNVRFTGTYTSLALASSADESWYSCVNDEFVPVAADAVLLPFSAALQTDGTHESYRLSIDGKTVGICGPTLTTEGAPADVYTIGGQFVRRAADATQALEGLPAGIYIVGGKKVVK